MAAAAKNLTVAEVQRLIRETSDREIQKFLRDLPATIGDVLTKHVLKIIGFDTSWSELQISTRSGALVLELADKLARAEVEKQLGPVTTKVLRALRRSRRLSPVLRQLADTWIPCAAH